MNSQAQSDLLELVRLAYKAAVEPSGWAVFLERYREALAGSCVAFTFWGRQSLVGVARATVGAAAEEALRGYNAHYGAVNPLVRHRPDDVRPGSITLSQARYPFEKFVRTEYYNDYIRKLDLACGIGVCIAETDGMCANITCLRSLKAGFFGRADVRIVQLLLPHLQRALQLHIHMRGLQMDHRTEAGALDQLTVGVILVSAEGRVFLMNASARRVLAAGDGLTLSSDGLRATSAAETKTLRQLISTAGRCARGESLHGGGVLRVSRPSLRQPLSVLVAPSAPTLAYPVLPPGCAAILVRDPDEAPDSGDVVARLYGLTPAETKLANQLLHGLTLESCGDALGISRETTRSHVKAILRKSGTHRQTDFVRQATRSIAGQVRV